MRGFALAVNAEHRCAAVEYGDDRYAIVGLANLHDIEQEDFVEGDLTTRGEVVLYNASQERNVEVDVRRTECTMIEALAEAEA